MVGVCAVSNVANPKAVDVAIGTVNQRDRGDSSSQYFKGLVVYRQQLQLRGCAGVRRFSLLKRIVKNTRDPRLDLERSINGDRTADHEWEQSDVIHPVKVVRMLVGVEDAVDNPDPFAKQLMPKIRGGIDEQIPLRKTDDSAAAGSVVARVCAFANRAAATDRGDTDAGAGSQKNHFSRKLDALAGECHGSRRWFKGKCRSGNRRDNASQRELRRLSSIFREFATPVFSQFNSCFWGGRMVDCGRRTFLGPPYPHGVRPQGHYNSTE